MLLWLALTDSVKALITSCVTLDHYRLVSLMVPFGTETGTLPFNVELKPAHIL